MKFFLFIWLKVLKIIKKIYISKALVTFKFFLPDAFLFILEIGSEFVFDFQKLKLSNQTYVIFHNLCKKLFIFHNYGLKIINVRRQIDW